MEEINKTVILSRATMLLSVMITTQMPPDINTRIALKLAARFAEADDETVMNMLCNLDTDSLNKELEFLISQE